MPEDINEVVVGLTPTDSASVPFSNSDVKEGLSKAKICCEERFSPGLRKNVASLAKQVAYSSKGKQSAKELEEEWSAFLQAITQYNA